MLTTEVKQKIEAWELPSEAEAKLLQHPNLCEYLLREKDKFPLPPWYIPQRIEFLLDNKLVYQINTLDAEGVETKDNLLVLENEGQNMVLGKLPDENCICSDDLESVTFVEVRFDDDCALFLLDRHKVIDRLSNLIVAKL